MDVQRVVIALVLVALAAGIALVIRRQRPEAPTQPRRATVPTQLDRADFARPEAPWLVAVFTSSTCDSCARAVPKAEALASDSVAVTEVPYQSQKDVHDRYAVDTVPTIVIADAAGVVRKSFVGTPSATDLWAAVADARDPGSSPEPDLGA
ncbi:MAG: hypothetical protein AVDCRST_MAG50-2146 [uncultured Acidimicrobiales bacterium]|uniref:Thioredoxin domain-containing protein n=1 Tax=uncultured Acidimicrobiales bacterium TaxID=310071 RepID=A0A6J4I0Z4_9ACTN|nr:MAG: hypothetical protein AVDCRST_MAG50-2146 [uncultured Acidimicrobiales bacterium]